MRPTLFPRVCAAAMLACTLVVPITAACGQGAPQPAGPRPLAIDAGPQLFLDEYVVERIDGLKRQVQQPRRLDQPVLDSKTFGTTQPYLTVLYEPAGKRFRIWYNHGP